MDDARLTARRSFTSPVRFAVRPRDKRVRILLAADRKRADINLTANDNLSALTLTLLANHQQIAQLLIEARADVNNPSSHQFYGITALVLAQPGGYTEMVALLRQKGATS